MDIDKLELVIDGLKGVIKTGEKVFADGKVGFEDSVHIPELYDSVSKVITALKEFKEIGEEIKDLNAAEAVVIVNKLFS